MKFNFNNKQKTVTQNHENARVFAMTPEMELYTAVVTTGLNDSFYEAENVRFERISGLLQKCDPEFVAKLAVYARTVLQLRSVSVLLSVALAQRVSGGSLVRHTIGKVVQRADEITELLACYQMLNERTAVKKLNRLSKQVQKGLATAFNNFDEYQFAKYDRNTAVKLKDALFLVHPKAKDEEQQLIFNKIASGKLATPYTWETQLSELGKIQFADADTKKRAIAQKWEAMIESKKIGYMALMRNLRNIIQAGVSGIHIQMVCDYLSDAKAVENSKQLPFRYLSAYREIKALDSGYVPLVLQALEKAVAQCAKNIKGFELDTAVVVACDVSGSMQGPVSARSSVLLYDIGLMLGMLMQSRCKNVVSGMFGDTWKTIPMPQHNILANVQEYYKREGEVGYATNGYLVLEDLIRRKKVVDKIMLFTDVQLWNSNATNDTMASCWKNYKKIAPAATLYLFDLAGHGTIPLQIRENNVYLIAGWSDKVFEILDAIENKETALGTILQVQL